MSAATARSARGALDDLMDSDELAFRLALASLTLLAGAFTAWVTVTPPRVHDAVVDAGVVSVYVADLPRIPLPEPVIAEVKPLPPPRLGPAPEARRPGGGGAGAPSEPAADAAKDASNSLLLQELGHLGERRDALSAVLHEDVTGGPLDVALQGVRSVETAAADDAMPRTIRRPLADAEQGIGLLGLEDLGGPGSATVTVRIAPQAGQAELEGPAATDAGEIARIVRKYQGGIVSCLERSLVGNPALSGRVELAWSIDRGRPTSVVATANTTGDAALAECMERAVRAMRFPPGLTAEVARFPWVVSGR